MNSGETPGTLPGGGAFREAPRVRWLSVWSELRAEFLKDADRGRQLHAFLTNTVEDLVENAESEGLVVKTAIEDKSVPVDVVVRGSGFFGPFPG